ncbi:MAG: hypothetical protein WEA61_07505 [Anaerolineales bacterium]
MDHRLIGSHYAQPPDAFWRRIYELCGVGEDRFSPMRTSLEEEPIRPYFNAGMLAVPPEGGLLQPGR